MSSSTTSTNVRSSGPQPPIPSFRKWLGYAKLFLGHNTRFCSHSHQRPKGAGKHREGEIVAGELVVTSGDATKMFDAIEEAFDDVPSSIQRAAGFG